MINFTSIQKTVVGIALFSFISGCAGMMGNLRRDLDDSDPYAEYGAPTTGGRWSERGLLQDAPTTDRVGHSERNPASSDIPMGEPSYVPYSPYSNASETGWGQDPSRDPSLEGLEPVPGQQQPAPMFSQNPNLPPPTQRLYKNGSRATKSDFVDEDPSAGSLWASDGQTNYYFTKNKIRAIGDIITVMSEDALYRDVLTEVKRSLTPMEREYELAIAQARIDSQTVLAANPGLGGDAAKGATDRVATSAAAPARAPAGVEAPKLDAAKLADGETKETRRATLADVDVAPALQFAAGEPIMTEIVERYPNGNYKVRGTKRMLYRGNYRMVSMVAIAKGADVGEDDTITSGKLYEYKLEVLR